MSKITLQTPIDDLYMVGEKYADYLKKYLNILTVEDLLYHFPFRYDDLSNATTLDQVTEGQTVTLQGQIIEIKNIYTRNGKQIQQAKFSDGTSILDITWFNQPYLIKNFASNSHVSIAGTIKRFGRKLTLTSPQFEIIKQQVIADRLQQADQIQNNILQTASYKHPAPQTTHTGRLVPVYPETALVSSKWLRSRIKPLMKELEYLIEDWQVDSIIEQERFISLDKAIKQIHFPTDNEELEQARKRLAFDELFMLALQMSKRKTDWQGKQLRHKVIAKFEILKPFIDSLPFRLTNDQTTCLHEIVNDLQSNTPMNRLLEGDVGSGKTVVAAAAMYLLFKSNLKSILMAPTEVLANQHFYTLQKLLSPHGVKIGFFTGAKKSKEDLESFDVYLGTHALLFQKLDHKNIGFVIIDEQHRFGVAQRATIIGEQSIPHVLTMTATPIPRTVALTVYGDLSLSVIKEMPIGRIPIKTWLVEEKKRQSSYEWIDKQITEHQTQAYFIYPLIDPSDKGTMREVKAATIEFEKLTTIFPKLKIGLLHGKLKSKEKDAVMKEFASGNIDILVSTTVVEVGIDVANASIMVINDASRFGLAQLHQLRGRVGRGAKQSYCLLFEGGAEQGSARLKAMETTHSGLALAELDLKLRGPGQIYGTMQSGFLDLKIASFNDHELIAKTHRWAEQVLSQLIQYPLLQSKLARSIMQSVQPN